MTPARGRLTDSLETALKLGAGVVVVSVIDGEEILFSEHFSCVQCGISLGEIAPRSFSFNSPHGACPACTGLGVQAGDRPGPGDPEQGSLPGRGRHPAVEPDQHARRAITLSVLKAAANHYGFSTKVPVA